LLGEEENQYPTRRSKKKKRDRTNKGDSQVSALPLDSGKSKFEPLQQSPRLLNVPQRPTFGRSVLPQSRVPWPQSTQLRSTVEESPDSPRQPSSDQTKEPPQNPSELQLQQPTTLELSRLPPTQSRVAVVEPLIIEAEPPLSEPVSTEQLIEVIKNILQQIKNNSLDDINQDDIKILFSELTYPSVVTEFISKKSKQAWGIAKETEQQINIFKHISFIKQYVALYLLNNSRLTKI
jgi:hypothetical protein